MSYEAHIAGVGDRPPGRLGALAGAAIAAMQRASARELAARRAAVVAAVRAVAPLRFVNGGGTGSVERTAAEPAVTEVAAGSGPVRADAVRRLPRVHAAPGGAVRAAGRAAAVRRAWRRCSAAATSPPARRARDRLPTPVLPPGLRLDRQEGAGEVQTPLTGRGRPRRCGSATACGSATPRPASCASASTRSTSCAGGEVVDTVPTYRGEGRAFL